MHRSVCRILVRSSFHALSVRVIPPVLLTFAGAAFASSALADDIPAEDRVAQLERRLEQERASRAAEREAFEKRLLALERARATAPTSDEITAAVESYLQEKDLFAAAPAEAVVPSGGSLLDVSVILDTTLGASTASDAALQAYSLGDHDPKVRGFNARNEELVLSADVDPYFYGFLDMVYKLDEAGESQFELEEAYAQTTSLPCHLQFRVGQFFTEFGRTNPTHPHAWEFLNYPVILGRVFGGDGWRGQGARLSWAVPGTCFPVTVLAGLQNARGETQASFRGVDGDFVGVHRQQDRRTRSLEDLVYNVRVEASRDFEGCRGTTTALLGVSGAFGPNATGDGGYTDILGADLTLKWKPRSTDAGWPFWSWQTEGLWRRFHADRQTQLVDDGMGGFVPTDFASRDYDDWGFYSQVVYGFARPWTAGVRIDYAHSDGAFAGDHTRASAALTYYPSEFSRIRLQAGYDRVDGLSRSFPGQSDENFGLWLNFDFSLGKHGAHKF